MFNKKILSQTKKFSIIKLAFIQLHNNISAKITRALY